MNINYNLEILSKILSISIPIPFNSSVFKEIFPVSYSRIKSLDEYITSNDRSNFKSLRSLGKV